MMKIALACSTLTSLLCLAGGALAQEGDAPAAAPAEEPIKKGKMNLSVPPPDAPLQRTAYNHEGFYLRFNAGPGFQYASAGSGQDSTDFALGADLLVGGSPSPGMVLGGALMGNVGFSGDTGFQYTIGPFFDAYPNSKDGWHLGLALGAAGTTQNSSVFGGGGAIWAGYDLWVAPEWSVGFLVRAGGAYMAGDNQSLGTFTTVGMISIVYH